MRYYEVLVELNEIIADENQVLIEGKSELPALRVMCVCDTPETHLCSTRHKFRFWQMDSLNDAIEVMRAGYAAQGRGESLAHEAIEKMIGAGIGVERPVYFCTYLEKA
jgi:hypothetical protein